jgi:lysophospholipase L1-like esterase
VHKRSIGAVLISVVATAGVLGGGLVGLSGVGHAASTPSPYYLSLGDSYSIGYQPGHGGTPGFTGYVAQALKMKAENFGCGGATTTSLIRSKGCGDPAAQNAVAYPGTTQEQAALRFIAAHKGAVRLITVSLGGNDFDGCSTAPCVKAAMPTMKANIESLLGSLHQALVKASDADATIVGLTYPDVELGFYVYPTDPPSSSAVTSARTSILAFDALINPNLRAAYQSVARSHFVDVTTAPYGKATKGGDTPLTVTESLAPYGTVPVAVGEVCQLTYFCSQGNIHADTQGYDFIGKLAVAEYRSA